MVAGGFVCLSNTATAVILFGKYELSLPNGYTGYLLIFWICFDFNVISVRNVFQ